MKREIKFRCFIVDSKKMMSWQEMLDMAEPTQTQCYLNDYFTSDSCLLMQFTGLLDKNGKEIYEGDVITTIYLSSGVVVFWNNGWNLEVSDSHYSFNTAFHTFKIIGNIHENPELLK